MNGTVHQRAHGHPRRTRTRPSLFSDERDPPNSTTRRDVPVAASSPFNVGPASVCRLRPEVQERTCTMDRVHPFIRPLAPMPRARTGRAGCRVYPLRNLTCRVTRAARAAAAAASGASGWRPVRGSEDKPKISRNQASRSGTRRRRAGPRIRSDGWSDRRRSVEAGHGPAGPGTRRDTPLPSGSTRRTEARGHERCVGGSGRGIYGRETSCAFSPNPGTTVMRSWLATRCFS